MYETLYEHGGQQRRASGAERRSSSAPRIARTSGVLKVFAKVFVSIVVKVFVVKVFVNFFVIYGMTVSDLGPSFPVF